MPNRIIRDTCRTSPTLDPLSDGAERCFWRLTTTADDYGRFLADPRTVLSACFPLKVGTLSVKRVAGWLEEMGRVDLVFFYRVGDRVYGQFVSAEKHFDRRARTSRYPDPTSANICSHVLADVIVPTQLPHARGQMSPFTGGFDSSSTGGHESLSTEERGTPTGSNPPSGANGAPSPPPSRWHQIPSFIGEALSRAPRLGADRRLLQPAWWQAHYRVNPAVDYGAEVLKAEAWLVAHPSKAPKGKDLSRFLHNWLGRVSAPTEA